MENRKQGFSKKTKIALTKFIKSAENPEIYGFPQNNNEEQKEAVIRVLKTIFKFEGDTVVGFDEGIVKKFYELTERPTIDIF